MTDKGLCISNIREQRAALSSLLYFASQGGKRMHANSFADCKNVEHKALNVRVRNRADRIKPLYAIEKQEKE